MNPFSPGQARIQGGGARISFDPSFSRGLLKSFRADPLR